MPPSPPQKPTDPEKGGGDEGALSESHDPFCVSAVRPPSNTTWNGVRIVWCSDRLSYGMVVFAYFEGRETLMA